MASTTYECLKCKKQITEEVDCEYEATKGICKECAVNSVLAENVSGADNLTRVFVNMYGFNKSEWGKADRKKKKLEAIPDATGFPV